MYILKKKTFDNKDTIQFNLIIDFCFIEIFRVKISLKNFKIKLTNNNQNNT